MNQKPVTIYTTKTCGYCRATKDLFKEHSIAFSEIDVTTDTVKQREMIEKSGQMGVPVTVIGQGSEEEIIIGYDRNSFGRALNLAL